MQEQPVFEFTSAHNRLIGALAKRMLWVAYFMFGAAALLLVGSVLAFDQIGAFGIVQGVLLLLIAIWTRRAAGAFGLIVSTAGKDIMYLMDALFELKRLYTLQLWVSVIALALVGLVVIVAIIAQL